jgi:hypothetical protein
LDVAPASADAAAGRASKECVERLVGALGELAAYAGLAAVGKAPPAAEEEGQLLGKALALLGEHPNWSEVAAASSFYAKVINQLHGLNEPRILCVY